MDSKTPLPETLIQAVKYFGNPDNCLSYLVSRRWPDGVCCPECGNRKVHFDRTRMGWRCTVKHPKRRFTLKTGTIFEDSPLGLDKWLPTVWMIANMKNGVSSHEVARAIGVTQKTAWFMLHRIRLAMRELKVGGKGGPMQGHVEADETYIGAKARNMHQDKLRRVGPRARWAGKVAVMGLLERHGRDGHSVIRTEVVDRTKRRSLQLEIRKHVKMDGKTTLYTDALESYKPVTPKGWMPLPLYMHKVIDHAEAYVDGQIHTNGLENYWSLLKRMLHGTYVSVEPFHLFRYLDEQAFRFNDRKATDAERFDGAISGIVGRRIMYQELIGEGNTPNGNQR